MNEFDLINSLLAGVNLIEASAGTGKTHTISFLFLRLILEKKLSVDKILVVTFTQAATQELKDRIFNILLMTRNALGSGNSNDVLIDTLIKKQKITRQHIELIQNAITDFDKASIFTIHGFCNRMLHDSAFETANRFDAELVKDPFQFVQEVTDDFWRKNIYQSPIEFVSYVYEKIKSPEYFFRLLDKVNALDIDIIPAMDQPNIFSLTSYRHALNELKEIWNVSRDEIVMLLTDTALKSNIYGSLKHEKDNCDFSERDMTIRSMSEEMDLFLDIRSIGFPLFKNFKNFTASKLNESVKKRHSCPSHKFFNACDDLYTHASSLEKEFDACLLYLKCCVFKYAHAELDKRKRKRNIHFFNDLILKVQNAVRYSIASSPMFIKDMQKKYKAALVDEFQDTDSVQYEIFSKLFSSSENILFMIGDPKQAIYSFRGADVFSYMEAARNTNATYTLTENWRSSKKLISAVNTIFSNINNPFIFSEIPFTHGKSAEKEIASGNEDDAPVKIWFVNSQNGKPLTKSDAEILVSHAVADEIALLVSSKKNRCKEKFQEEDIGVLVRTNRQAMVIRNHLSSRNIHSVIYSTGDIFESHEAYEMERLLASLNHPGNDRKLKAALCTDLMGAAGHMFELNEENLKWLDDKFKNFHHYTRLWEEKGFIRMFNHCMENECIKQRLLSFPDGERRITNILHLAELLHEESVTNKRGMAGLLKWLSEQRDLAAPRREENQLHLESDKRAVHIVTIHKSKGLEYPVVFCPFTWEGMIRQNDDILFHDETDGKNLTLDLSDSETSSHLAMAQKEKFAENIRLFYVALTRAKKVCYLTWGNIKSADTSPFSYLLYGDKIKRDTDILSALKNHFSSKSPDELLSDVQQVSSRSEGAIEVLKLIERKDSIPIAREKDAEKNLCSRKFQGYIDTSWKIMSYSSLLSARDKEPDAPDHDVIVNAHADVTLGESDDILLSDDSIFEFPKGAKAGIFFHNLLEQIDFTCSKSEIYESLVKEKLLSYGFDSKWRNTVCRVIDNIRSVPLKIDRTTLKLSLIENNHRINEMEFYYPTRKITPEKIVHLFSTFQDIDSLKEFPSKLEKLLFEPAQGFMKGYIDLVFRFENKFYLIDWKSNFLGSDIKNYTSEYLAAEMNHALYTLQYHIYTLALHQYLTCRYPEYRYEKNFGGVFYIFLRGVDKNLGSGYGIYRDLPNPDLLYNLGKLLLPEFKM